MTHVVVVTVNEASNRVITGINVYDRANGGVLELPSGSSFPGTSYPNEIFWRIDTDTLYIRNNANTTWIAIAGSGSTGITSEDHKALRQLIHFLEDGPGDGFSTASLFKETEGIPFPTRITWWDSAIQDKRIFQTEITSSGVFPVTETYKVYDTDGVTVLKTATDVITYASQCFEVGRTRTIS